MEATCISRKINLKLHSKIFGVAPKVKREHVFNESALRPIHSISRDVRLCVCVSVTP